MSRSNSNQQRMEQKGIVIGILFVLSASLLTSCSEEATEGKNSQIAPTYTPIAVSSINITDGEIKEDVVDELHWSERVDASQVQVEVQNGLVTLDGVVSSFLAREEAYDDALFVSGVVGVQNNLDVVYPAEDVLSDEEIQERIELLYEWDIDLDVADLTVSVQEGIVNIEGTVGAYWEKILAENIAEDVVGVIDITNNIAVTPTEDVVDEIIATAVVDALERRAVVTAEEIDVKVNNGVVTISGTVGSWYERIEAFNAAAYTRNVQDINDMIVVSP